MCLKEYDEENILFVKGMFFCREKIVMGFGKGEYYGTWAKHEDDFVVSFQLSGR